MKKKTPFLLLLLLLLLSFFLLPSSSSSPQDNLNKRFGHGGGKKEREKGFHPLNLTNYLVKEKGWRWGREVEGLAVMFSPSFGPSVPFVIDVFLKRLPPRYQVVVLTTPTRQGAKMSLLRLVGQANKRNVWVLPILSTFFTKNEYSCHLISPEFYEGIPSENLLIFQSDSLVLKKDDGGHDLSPNRYEYLRDFHKFSYVGAPWPKSISACTQEQINSQNCFEGGNGGLSFRRPHALSRLLPPLSPDTIDCPHEDRVIARYILNNSDYNNRNVNDDNSNRNNHNNYNNHNNHKSHNNHNHHSHYNNLSNRMKHNHNPNHNNHNNQNNHNPNHNNNHNDLNENGATISVNLRIPERRVATSFAGEGVFHGRKIPWGVHKPWPYSNFSHPDLFELKKFHRSRKHLQLWAQRHLALKRNDMAAFHSLSKTAIG